MKINSDNRSSKNKGYWKFNSGLLKNKEYCKRIKEIIAETEKETIDTSFCNKLEFFKYKIRESSIKFSKELIKEKRKEGSLFQEISKYCEKVEINGDDKEKLLILQAKLDDMYCKRAHHGRSG